MEPCKMISPKLLFPSLLACVLLPTIFFSSLNYTSNPSTILSLQLSIQAYMPLPTDSRASQKRGRIQTQDDVYHAGKILPLKLEEKQRNNDTILEEPRFRRQKPSSRNNMKPPAITLNADPKPTPVHIIRDVTQDVAYFEGTTLPFKLEEKQRNKDASSKHEPSTRKSMKPPAITNGADPKPFPVQIIRNVTQERDTSSGGNPLQNITCDFTGSRSDTCSIHGDSRVLGRSLSIILPSPSSNHDSSWSVRPYARKWEGNVMQRIKNLTIIQQHNPPRCSITHEVPTIIFSTGGFLGNFFHDFTDVLVPLFITSRHYNGEVQFMVTDYNPRWINKYEKILRQLSNRDIINLEAQTNVHCFRELHVGLESHKVLGIDPTKFLGQVRYSMKDFRDFLANIFALRRRIAHKPSMAKSKPRLMILLRKRSRAIMNSKEVITIARRMGYKVITATVEKTKNLTEFARLVNSCDVMVGVHGAGLANMIFLPMNATVVQIIPWGGLTWASRHDFGEPAPDMGLRYVEYEIRKEESSLIDEYPRDHAVFKDPLSIHRQGWNQLWYIFLDKQRVKLDVSRFRLTLAEIMKSFRQ